MNQSEYNKFLESKIKLAEKTGFEIQPDEVNPILFPFQNDVVRWAISGGRRAGFLSFGMGKTVIQLEVCRIIHERINRPALIVCPLGVKQEFVRDASMLGMDVPRYITDMDQVDADQWLYITNYERIRMESIDPEYFGVASFDEASILRSLDAQIVDVLMQQFKSIPYRFVFTATPSPNRYLELTHYADYLDIMDRGQILTRFFKRDSTKAGNLKLYDRRASEFWHWMASWACFITKPSDLGYSDEGYDLPELKIHHHRLTIDRGVIYDKRDGQTQLIANAAGSLQDLSREKRKSLEDRVNKALEIVRNDPDNHYLIWHELNDERDMIRAGLDDCRIVDGSMNIEKKEDALIAFSQGEYKYLATKPKIAGSGCNFQYHCHKAIFCSVGYKFNDFIQAVHRIYRFGQGKPCEIHLILTDAEETVLQALEKKWAKHRNLQSEMTDIIKRHGLNADLYRSDLKRQMFDAGERYEGRDVVLVNDDNVNETRRMESDSVGLIVTSIPFGNHYEYSENYNCFGHNESNEDFFRQMDFLTPELYRVLKPGRICAVHVKDRIRYSYMNGTGFTTLEPFSDHTNLHFLRHGFHLMGRITITTDVVAENNQTYRLGHSEKCKDGTKMGVGIPEYVLVFRKAPTHSDNAYADEPVRHEKKDYPVSQWQLDAHSYWKSDGKRLISTEMLQRLDLSQIGKLWKKIQKEEGYSYKLHKNLCQQLDELGKLPRKYMAVSPASNHPDVWTDIVRMKTLNSSQARRNMNQHICPLQLDLIERLIERYSNPDDLVYDPFAGLGSVPYMALKMKRKGYGCELNAEYFKDSITHVRSVEAQSAVLTLF